MDSNELSGDQATTAEELSEESADSSSSSSGGGGSGRGGSSGHTSGIPSFHPYKRLDELVSVAGKNGEDNDDMVMETGHGATGPRFADYGRLADGADLPMALDKPKDYAVQRNEMYSESSSADEPTVTGGGGGSGSGGLFRRELQGHKEVMYSFCREIREIRQKSLHAALERTAGGGKDLELIKTYGLPLERMKDFGGLTSKIGSIALDRLRGAPLHGDVTPSLEPEDLKSLPLPTRQQQQNQIPDTPAIAFERLRHAHPLFQGVTAESTQNPQFPHHTGHHHHHHQHHQQQQQSQQQQSQQQHVPHPHHAITQITQMQHSGSQHQQHQQQAKSFTIDAILGLRSAGQRDKHARHHSYRKHQGQEGSAKSLSASSCSNGGAAGGGGGGGGGGSASSGGGTGGKLKRVRTIFTAEQLERLEGEFARQQYMVGPERLYLAHALRLTEAQVKVWFQNRRIKWRKLNHEQASQRLHELHQTTMTPAEREDSNENGTEW